MQKTRDEGLNCKTSGVTNSHQINKNNIRSQKENSAAGEKGGRAEVGERSGRFRALCILRFPHYSEIILWFDPRRETVDQPSHLATLNLPRRAVAEHIGRLGDLFIDAAIVADGDHAKSPAAQFGS